jgi:hypothetical protein
MMKIKMMALCAMTMTTLTFADNTNATKEGAGYIKMLMEGLKSELMPKMQQDPTGVSAMGFCSVSAMKITQDLNDKLPNNATLRRTALKLRNPENKADTIDIEVMNGFTKAIEEKTLDLEKPLKVVNDGNTTRVYRALVTIPMCLQCHGTNISKEVNDTIKALYPKDEAIGFAEGTLRGVIVAEIKNH